MCVGFGPTSNVATTLPRLRLNLRHGLVGVVRHPEPAFGEGNPDRIVADANRPLDPIRSRVDLDHGVADGVREPYRVGSAASPAIPVSPNAR